MTAIKIKAGSKLADASPSSAAENSSVTSISSGDDAAPASSNAQNNHDNAPSDTGGSSNENNLSENDGTAVNGEVDGSLTNAGQNEDALEGDGANHDSNDGAENNSNVKTEDAPNADNAAESGADEKDTPSDAEDVSSASASGKDAPDQEDGGDAHENVKQDSNEEEVEEMWELKKILTVEEITSKTLTCSTIGCPNAPCSVYQSNLDTEAWFSCLDCQDVDYGGWPENKSEIPLAFMTKQHRETICQYCTRSAHNAVFPDLPTSRDGEEEKSDEDDGGEKWDLIEVIALKDLKKKKPSKCQEEGCTLAACSVWACNGEEWYGCIDCSESYYGGWPSYDEMPVKHLTEEHRALLSEKCSKKEDPHMPDLPTMPLLATATAGGGGNASNITPLPHQDQAVAANQSNLVVGAFKGKKSGVTPSPMPPKGSSKQAAVKVGKKAAEPKVDAKTQALYDKYQADANRMGGPKIVLDKNAAKKVVFDKLHDLFSPVNITQLYQKLKGQIPQPLLRKCLDAMVDKTSTNPFADDSEDEEDTKSSKKKKSSSSKKKPSDEYAASVSVKEGRNASTTLYFIDHTKLRNNGNGLLPEDRNELVSNLESSKQEFVTLQQKHKQISQSTAQLLSEPKNAELETELHELTNKMEVVESKLGGASAYESNAKYARQLKERIGSMASEWRSRKRLCAEFIGRMEDATDGTISMKKCAKGDGPIYIETDEAAIKGAKEYAESSKKRPRLVTKSNGLKRNGNGQKNQHSNSGMQPDEKFIGVLMSSSGMPTRVYLDES